MNIAKELFIKAFASFAISLGLFIILFILALFTVGYDSAKSLFHPLFFVVAILIAFPFVYKYMKVK
jgi:hypothetical protein